MIGDMNICSHFIACLYAVGFSFSLLLVPTQDSVAQTATPPPPTLHGIPPPPNDQPKQYFEWSYDLPLADKITSVQRPLFIPMGQKVTVTCVAVSSSNLPDGQSLSGEIRFLSNFGGNANPLMRVGLPPVTKIQG
jgi:hypothetical protein